MHRFSIALVSSVAVVMCIGCDEPAPSPQAEPRSAEPQAPLPQPSEDSADPRSAATSATVPTKTPVDAAGGADGTPQPSTSASAAASGSGRTKRPKKPRCARGAYVHEEPKFCIRVPDGYAPSSVKSGGVMDGVLFQSTAPGTMDLTVTWIQRPRSVYVEERNELKAAVTAADGKIMNTRDDRGLYGRYEREMGGQPVIYSESVTYRRGFIFWCKAQAFEKPKPPPGFLTACQTLMGR